jgi:hypothetical protein
MRYLTWKLSWSEDNKYGYGPEKTAADNGGLLEASSWSIPDVETGRILGYMTNDVPLELLSEWDVVELSKEEALEFAKAVDQNAYIAGNSTIATTTPIFDDQV